VLVIQSYSVTGTSFSINVQVADDAPAVVNGQPISISAGANVTFEVSADFNVLGTKKETVTLMTNNDGKPNVAINIQVLVTVALPPRFIPDTNITKDYNPGAKLNTWKKLLKAPQATGEVATGIINDVLYVIGEATGSTQAFNILTGVWTTTAAKRPYAGNHHTSQVYNGQWYVFGGLSGGGGKVQIFNPQTNSWRTGKNMPWGAGACASALIGSKVFVFGGIVGGGTTGKAGVYDIIADTWLTIASMPQPANHASGGTDGYKVYIFNGRGGGNVPSSAYKLVQIYDPETNTYVTSKTSKTILADPNPRGGSGNAVMVRGEFYVIGGEAPATNAVRIYDPRTNKWRLGANMPTARHGISPSYDPTSGLIYVACGGVHAGMSQSNVLEAYAP